MKTNDIIQSVTAKIIEKIELGVKPWECPWIKSGNTVNPMPYNFVTKQDYKGLNVLILWTEMADRGYSHNSWLTFKQAQTLGGSVRKGEKSVRCVFYKPIEVSDQDEEKQKFRFILKTFNLFNVEQVEGLDLPEEDCSRQEISSNRLDDDLMRFCEKEGIGLRYGGDRAYYSPAIDIIKLPNTFTSDEGFLATFTHEVGHSTGHKRRLDRFPERFSNGKDFKDAYGKEELIAEISSALLMASYGELYSLENHASYLEHWLGAIKEDPKYLFQAASKAAKVIDYFHESIALLEADVA